MDGPIDPAPSHQGGVGSVDNGIDLQTSDISAPQGHLAGEGEVRREAGWPRGRGVGVWGRGRGRGGKQDTQTSWIVEDTYERYCLL